MVDERCYDRNITHIRRENRVRLHLFQDGGATPRKVLQGRPERVLGFDQPLPRWLAMLQDLQGESQDRLMVPSGTLNEHGDQLCDLTTAKFVGNNAGEGRGLVAARQPAELPAVSGTDQPQTEVFEDFLAQALDKGDAS